MLTLREEDFRIVAHELSEICRTMAYIFPLPFVVTLLYLPALGVLDLFTYMLWKLLVFTAPSMACYILYLLLRRVGVETEPRTRHTMMTVAVVWFLVALVGALPYVLGGVLNPLDALFESMSGWSTTGLTMIPAPESIDRDILFYRSYTNWVGGIGIIVLALIVFLRRGTVAMDYYASEVGEQRIRPRLTSTIGETWKIYIVYTIAFIALMYIAGMDIYDAVIHTLSALSTAGFSSHANSIGYYNSHANSFFIQLVVMGCMITGAISFFLHFRLFEGDYKNVLRNIELRYFAGFIAAATFLVFAWQYLASGGDVIKTFMEAFFHTVSAISTTGMQTGDLTNWAHFPLTVLMMLMFMGGLYASTVGGLKMLRVVLIIKVVEYGIKKLMLPRTAVIRIKIEGRHIDWNAVVSTFGFTALYVFAAVAGAACLMMLRGPYDGLSSMFIVASALGNVGLSNVGGDAWYFMHPFGKIVLILLMWLGRIEIFPALVLFSAIWPKTRSSPAE